MHWSRVWQRLAAHHELIAPDLPGLGALREPPLASVADYAQWLADLLDALSLESATCIGNSFGASVAYSFAGRFPERCTGLVLVDGFPMPRTPAALTWLSRLPGARRLGIELVSRFVYTEKNLSRAFADKSNMPAELRRAIMEDWQRMVAPYVDILIAGDGAPAPRVPPLLIWGKRDRLPGSSPKNAVRWHERLPGSTLKMIEDAGHFPQIEAPDAFVEAVETFLGSNQQEKEREARRL